MVLVPPLVCQPDQVLITFLSLAPIMYSFPYRGPLFVSNTQGADIFLVFFFANFRVGGPPRTIHD